MYNHCQFYVQGLGADWEQMKKAEIDAESSLLTSSASPDLLRELPDTGDVSPAESFKMSPSWRQNKQDKGKLFGF